MNIPSSGDKLTWVSAHLFCGEPWEEFLALSVKPIIENLRREYPSLEFFFIRYWEKGPHIRLRIKVQEADRQRLRDYLTDHFSAWFLSNPTSRSNFFLKKNPLPNDSIQFIDYEPETERYGGPMGILVAEKLFQLSSEITLGLIADSFRNWGYETAMGYAIALHLILLQNNDPEIASILKDCQYLRDNFAKMTNRAFASDDGSVQDGQKIHRSFEQSYDAQKAQLVPFVFSMRNVLLERQTTENEWFDKWIAGTGPLLGEIHQLAASGHLTIRPQDIMPSYIHMTNNRLGLWNVDEEFIIYLLKRALEEA